MSHTSSQSSHNPAPDTGPPIDPVWEALTDTNQRLQKLEAIVLHMNDRIEQQAPLLINLSQRLEALEDKLNPPEPVIDRWEGDDKIDFKGTNNWENEGGQ